MLLTSIFVLQACATKQQLYSMDLDEEERWPQIKMMQVRVYSIFSILGLKISSILVCVVQ